MCLDRGRAPAVEICLRAPVLRGESFAKIRICVQAYMPPSRMRRGHVRVIHVSSHVVHEFIDGGFVWGRSLSMASGFC